MPNTSGDSLQSSSHLLGVTPVIQTRLNQASDNQVKTNFTYGAHFNAQGKINVLHK